MNRIVLITILIGFLSQFSPAQSTGAVGFKITDTKSFFEQFTANKEQQERGEFETKEEYERRTSKQADTTSVLYFKLDVIPLHFFKNYKYDIDAEKLTVTGGKCINYRYYDYTPSSGAAVVIRTRSEDKGKYKASNAFGKTITVDKTYLYDYVLDFANSDYIPDSVFDKSECAFTLSITRGPKEAEKLSKNLFLVVGVNLHGYQQSTYQCVEIKEPKIDSPSELGLYSYLIEVRFVKILLYDQVTKTILTQYEFSQ